VATGRLHRVYRGVYTVGRPGLSLHGRWMAAVLVCGPDALLSHRSAAMLHDLARTDVKRIDVTAHRRGGRTHHGLTVHRAGGLTAADRTVVSGIPVSSVSRTLLDLAAVLPLQRLERALGQAERLRVFDLGPIRDALARAPRHRGALRLRAALADLTLARWRVIRITWSQIISDPERILRLLGALLEAPAGRTRADTMPRGPAA